MTRNKKQRSRYCTDSFLVTANEAESTPSGESPKIGSLATTKDSASLEKGVVGNSEAGHRQTQTLIPDSDTIISKMGNLSTREMVRRRSVIAVDFQNDPDYIFFFPDGFAGMI